MGGITHGCITRAGQAVSGPLTGAAFPECLAAVPQRAVEAPKSPAALCWRAKRIHLPQTQVIRFSPGPYTANWENTLLLLLLLLQHRSHSLPLCISFTSQKKLPPVFTMERVVCVCLWDTSKKKKKKTKKKSLREWMTMMHKTPTANNDSLQQLPKHLSQQTSVGVEPLSFSQARWANTSSEQQLFIYIMQLYNEYEA